MAKRNTHTDRHRQCGQERHTDVDKLTDRHRNYGQAKHTDKYRQCGQERHKGRPTYTE